MTTINLLLIKFYLLPDDGGTDGTDGTADNTVIF
jgi:hypothetical protein